MYGINADEGILLDWDELADGELKAVEAMCPDAYSVALHLLNGDMGLEDDRWARSATDPVGDVCLLACEASSLGEYCGIDPVEAAVAWLEDISEIDGVREQEASRFLQHLGELCEDDTFARVPAKECGSFLELGSYGHNFWLAVENSNGRANAETKDRNHEEIGISPSFDMNDAELSAGWYHLTSFDVLDALSGSFPEAVESAHENPTLAATASTVTGDEPAHEDEQGREARDGEEI